MKRLYACPCGATKSISTERLPAEQRQSYVFPADLPCGYQGCTGRAT